jgi:hypothetical protein
MLWSTGSKSHAGQHGTSTTRLACKLVYPTPILAVDAFDLRFQPLSEKERRLCPELISNREYDALFCCGDNLISKRRRTWGDCLWFWFLHNNTHLRIGFLFRLLKAQWRHSYQMLGSRSRQNRPCMVFTNGLCGRFGRLGKARPLKRLAKPQRVEPIA